MKDEYKTKKQLINELMKLRQRITELEGSKIELKRAQEALQRQREELQIILDSVPAMIFYKDKENRFVRVNKAFVETIKMPKERIEGNTCFELFPNQAEVYWKTDKEVIASGCPKRKIIEQFETAEGKKWFLKDKIPYRNEEGDIVGLIGFSIDITERMRAKEKLLSYQDQLRTLTSKLSLTEERERRSIATELHDRIGHALAITRIKLESLKESASSTSLGKALDEIFDLIQQMIQDTRLLTYEISPPILYELGLEAAIEWLVERIQEQHGILTEFEDDRQPKPMYNDIRVLLFKAVRELLINVAKHAHARSAKVSIQKNNNSIQIDVKDNGVGFNVSALNSHLEKTFGFGLFNIRERLDHLGGHIEIVSKPGRGTWITMVAPLKHEEET